MVSHHILLLQSQHIGSAKLHSKYMYLDLSLSDVVHVVSNVTTVNDDLRWQIKHVPHHQRQHPTKLLRGSTKQGGLG